MHTCVHARGALQAELRFDSVGRPPLKDGGINLRRFAWPIVVGFLVVGALGVVASTALGQLRVRPTPRVLPGSNFQGGDGNQADEGGQLDWHGLYAAGGVGHTMDFAGPSVDEADDQFTQGSEELNPGQWHVRKEGSVPSDDNLLDIYRGFEHPDGGSALLYLAFVREAGLPSDSSVTLELNQRPGLWENPAGTEIPCRVDGDLLITFDVSGDVVHVGVNKWVTDTHASNGCALTGDLVAVSDSDLP